VRNLSTSTSRKPRANAFAAAHELPPTERSLPHALLRGLFARALPVPVVPRRDGSFFLIEFMTCTLMGELDTSKSTVLNQSELRPLLGAIRTKPKIVDWALISKCHDEIEALQLCVQLSRYKYEVLAEKLGIDKGHFTRIMQGQGHLPARKRTQLMSICGNLAPVQFDCLRFGLKVKEDDDLDEKEQQALATLAMVKRAKELRVAA
jgi:hypothetical protein